MLVRRCNPAVFVWRAFVNTPCCKLIDRPSEHPDPQATEQSQFETSFEAATKVVGRSQYRYPVWDLQRCALAWPCAVWSKAILARCCRNWTRFSGHRSNLGVTRLEEQGKTVLSHLFVREVKFIYQQRNAAILAQSVHVVQTLVYGMACAVPTVSTPRRGLTTKQAMPNRGLVTSWKYCHLLAQRLLRGLRQESSAPHWGLPWICRKRWHIWASTRMGIALPSPCMAFRIMQLPPSSHGCTSGT